MGPHSATAHRLRGVAVLVGEMTLSEGRETFELIIFTIL
jgi:hypothetical protein